MALSRIVPRLARNPGTEFTGGDEHSFMVGDDVAVTDHRHIPWPTGSPNPSPFIEWVRAFIPRRCA